MEGAWQAAETGMNPSAEGGSQLDANAGFQRRPVAPDAESDPSTAAPTVVGQAFCLGMKAAVHESLCLKYARAGRLLEAREQLQGAITQWRELFAETDGCVAATLEDLAIRLIEQGDVEVAELALRECLQMRRRSAGPADANSARTLDRLVGCLVTLERYEEAKSLLVRECEEACSEPHVSPERVVDALERVMALHALLGTPEKMSDWHHQQPPAVPGTGIDKVPAEA